MAMCGNCGAQNPANADRCGSCAADLNPLASYAPREDGVTPVRRDTIVTAAQGKLYGLRVLDGVIVWWNQLGPEDDTIFEVQIHEDRVYALTMSGQIFCIDYASGRTRWTHPTEPGADAALMIVAGLVFVAHGDTLDCLNTHGYLLWSQLVPGIGRRTRITLAIPKPYQS